MGPRYYEVVVHSTHEPAGQLLVGLRPKASLVDEFKDRMVRREGIEKEWKSFLREYRAAAWPDIFGRFADESVGCAEWRKEIEEILRSAEHIRAFLVD